MNVVITRLVDQLYRSEYGRLVATLVRQFGKDQLELAEDAVQEAFIKALEHWETKGIPDHPQAWLYTVVHNNALKRLQKENRYATSNIWLSTNNPQELPPSEHWFQPKVLQDNLLGALYLCTGNDLSEKAQIALILKTLAGFTVTEVAAALYLNEDATAKMLVRARQQLREDKTPFLDPYILVNEHRTQTVLHAIYLIFNLGYFDQHTDYLIRKDLCYEALYLAKLMANLAPACKTDCNALLSLILLHLSRLEARFSNDGALLSLQEQERSRWNRQMMLVGAHYLNRSFSINPPAPSRFQIEAAIAFLHTTAKTYAETPWQQILYLYNLLETKGNYPSAALAKAYV
ncbi:MAG: RNA polymerase sigma factor, partial [Saprospiraceae bacterium]